MDPETSKFEVHSISRKNYNENHRNRRKFSLSTGEKRTLKQRTYWRENAFRRNQKDKSSVLGGKKNMKSVKNIPISTFQIVANYYGANKTLEYVPGKSIHWSGGRLEPPPDTPKCGFDGSLCPDNCKHSHQSFLYYWAKKKRQIFDCNPFNRARVQFRQTCRLFYFFPLINSFAWLRNTIDCSEFHRCRSRRCLRHHISVSWIFPYKMWLEIKIE